MPVVKSKKQSRKHEIGVTAMLVLPMVLLFMFPWLWLSAEKNQSLTGRHPFADIREWRHKAIYGPTYWRMKVSYRPQSGTLQMSLSHRQNVPTKGLNLVAHFSPDGGPPAASTQLQSQSDGKYRSEDLKLESGNWLMSVTGRRRSKVVFILEQPFFVK